MKVFLSWSGSRSKAVAETLGDWLASVIQAVEPWISSGIQKGARWQVEVADKLEEARIGIVCLTPSNLTAPWLLFEAGALSKTKGSSVCTFLLDLAPADIELPLGQFQHTSFSRDEVRRLVESINRAVQDSGERSLTSATLNSVFETFWPQLETKLLAIRSQEEQKPPQREERALLEEILDMLRAQERRRRANLPFGLKRKIGSIKTEEGTVSRERQERMMAAVEQLYPGITTPTPDSQPPGP